MSILQLFFDEKEIPQSGFPQTEFISAVHHGGIPLERAATMLIDFFRRYQWKFYHKYKHLRLEQDEAIDAYTDAVMELISRIRSGTFDAQYSLSTYLFRLTKNRCIDRLRAKGYLKNKPMEEIPEISSTDNSSNFLHDLLNTEAFQSVMSLLDQIQGRCKEIILKWGYWGYSMKEIAEEMGMKNAEVVRVQKSRCLKRLHQSIEKTPDFPALNHF